MKKLLAGLILFLTVAVSFGQGVKIQWATTNTGPVVSNIVIILSSNLMPNRLSATNPTVSQLRVYAATNQNAPGFWLDPTTITPGAATNTYELSKTGTGLTLETNGLLYVLGLNLPLSNLATNNGFFITNLFRGTLFMQNPASPTFWTLGNSPNALSTLGLSLGGAGNALGQHTGEVIIGGTLNYANGDRAVIIGATSSTNESDYASGIYGGRFNVIGSTEVAQILGGIYNRWDGGDDGVIAGGMANTNADGLFGAMLGGKANSNGAEESGFTLGGESNRITAGIRVGIVGGKRNVVSANDSYIFGGIGSTISGTNSFVIGSGLTVTPSSTIALGYGSENMLITASQFTTTFPWYFANGSSGTIPFFRDTPSGIELQIDADNAGLNVVGVAQVVFNLGGGESFNMYDNRFQTTAPWYFANGASGIVPFFRDTPSGIELRIDADDARMQLVGADALVLDANARYIGNASGVTNILEAALVYPAANPAAGLVLTSTSSNTAAWLAPTGGGGGGGPLSGGFTNGSGQITASGHSMTLNDPGTGWTNLNWTDQTLSTDNTNVLSWYDKWLIGNWTVTNGNFTVVGTGPGIVEIADADSAEAVSLTVPSTVLSNYTITLPSSNGINGNALTLAGGKLAWVTPGGSPGGSDTQVQFNDGGSFGGDAGLTYLKTQDTLLVGSANSASGSRGFVSGANNVIGSSGINNGFIGGGIDNFLDAGSSAHTSILGGQQNTNLSLFNGVLVGGRFNRILAVSSGGESLLGGVANRIGGDFSTVTGGRTNIVFGNYSVALGGLLNVVSNNYATAGGFKTRSMHEGSWIWADHSTDDETVSAGDNTFNVRARGGVYMESTNGFYLMGSPIMYSTNLANTVLADLSKNYAFVSTNNNIAFTGISGFPVGGTNMAWTLIQVTNNSVGAKTISTPAAWQDTAMGTTGAATYYITNSAWISIWVYPGVSTNFTYRGGTK